MLGQLGELMARRAPSGFDLEAAAHLLSDPPDGRLAELGHDADLVYLLTSDGAAAVGKLGDGSLRRLAPAGWRSPGAPRHAADGSVLGVCGYKLGGDPFPAVTAARSWVLDGSGQRLATLPGCLYDVAADGGSALVADPAEGRRAGPVPGREFLRRSPVGGSDQLTRGLRLWRRDGSFRPVLGFDDVVRVFRTVQPGVDPRGLVVVTAVLGPDGRQALVRIVDALADVDPRTGREVEVLAVVDLERGRAEPAPEHLPGFFAFLPTGGWALTGGAGTATYLPPDRPPQLLRSGIAGDGVYAIEPSPDGAWLLLAGATWRFIRADDPSVQVSYPAPGRLASWVPGAGPMSSLRLALRGLRARAGLSVALLAVTTFAVGVGAAGAIYLRAAGESLLAQNLRSATSHTAGLHVSQVVADGRELRGLTQSVAVAGPAVPALAAPVAGLETRTPIELLAEGGRPGSAYLASRDGICDRLVVEAGRCPVAQPLGLPAEVAVSRRTADWLRLGPGDRFQANGFGAGAAGRDLVVVAVYTPTPYDPYWFGAQPAYFPPPPTGNELPPLDAVFLAGGDLLPVIDNGSLDIRARFDHFVQPDRMRLADTAAVPPALGQVAELLRINNPNAVVLTGLGGLVAKAEADRQALTVPVLLADVQLASLALLILIVVAAMAAEARAGEVALAKVRGATTGQAFGLAVLELAMVAALALPAGLAVGWLGALLLARSQFEAGIPVVVTPAAVAVAVAATVVALAAARLASLGAVRRRILDQWRRGRLDRVGRRAVVLDVVLLLVAVGALANLRASGTRQASGGYDVLATLAPGLAVLAAALVVG
ncbi:MAG TPA: FtsX-like permease family protein, partial [Actinomycetes bacterium]|nr:FtsX-like permease family protein [Actinomycetes bacterium]